MPNDTKKTHPTGFASTKEGGYANQKRYRKENPEKVREQKRKQNARLRLTIYEPKVRMPRVNKPYLDQLLQQTGMTISELCWSAVQEKYGVNFREPIDKSDEQ